MFAVVSVIFLLAFSPGLFSVVGLLPEKPGAGAMNSKPTIYEACSLPFKSHSLLMAFLFWLLSVKEQGPRW